MFVSSKKMFLAAVFVLTVVAPKVGRAEWDLYNNQDVLYLSLNTEQYLTKTELDVFVSGDELVFEIREYIGNMLVDVDSTDVDVDDFYALVIRGSNTVEDIDIDVSTVGIRVHILTGDGNDIVYGGTDINTGGGNDRIYAGAFTEKIQAGSGDDYVSCWDAWAGVDVSGATGNDRIRGSRFDDFLDGGSGDDIILGRDGNDILLGGNGTDSLNGHGGNDFIDPGYFNGTAEQTFGGLGSDVFHPMGIGGIDAHSHDVNTGEGDVVDGRGWIEPYTLPVGRVRNLPYELDMDAKPDSIKNHF